jgi:hypothetical protein
MDTPTIVIIVLVSLIIIGLGSWITYDIVNNKAIFSIDNFKMERNLSNDRDELPPIPAHLKLKDTASRPNVSPSSVEHYKNAHMRNGRNMSNNMRNMSNNMRNMKKTTDGKVSTFCVCNGLIDQDCTPPQESVNSYEAGNTEYSVLRKNPNWRNTTMPYDQYISNGNNGYLASPYIDSSTVDASYINYHTNWFDVMPYDIYANQTMNAGL